MNKKTILMILLILLALIIFVWKPAPEKQVTTALHSNKSVPPVSALITATQEESSPVLKEAGEKSVLNQVNVSLPEGRPTSTKEHNQAAQGTNPSLTNQHAAGVTSANPIPTDNQIRASIALHQQQYQKQQEALADRKNQIHEVHQAILAEQENQPSDDSVKPFIEPILTVPADVAEKIKSHQVTVH